MGTGCMIASQFFSFNKVKGIIYNDMAVGTAKSE
jgi:hypothetical protein